MLARKLTFAAAIVAFLATVGGAAAAVDPDQAAREAELRGYYLEPGVGVDIGAMEGLVADVAGRDLYFVALVETPPGGGDLFADEVLARLGSGTVVVVSADEVAAVSSRYGDGDLNRAIDASLDAFDRTYPDGFAAFAAALTASAEPAAGGAGRWLVLLVVVGVVGLVAFTLVRSSRRDRVASAARVEEAKAEIRSQLATVANQILEHSDRVALSQQDRVEELFRQANETYAEVEERLEGAVTVRQLEELSDRLDRARWQLESVDALLEGREPPPEPAGRPAACFFDPTHGAGVEQADIRTAAGTRTVGVCRRCAAQLRRGERPEPRSISVGGRSVPAPQAPRSHGGGGFDWLGAFSLILHGLPSGRSYDWGRRRRSGLGGLFGGGRGSAGRSGSGARSGRWTGGRASRRRASGRMGRARRRR